MNYIYVYIYVCVYIYIYNLLIFKILTKSTIVLYKLRNLRLRLIILVNSIDSKAAVFYLNFCCISEIIYKFVTCILLRSKII